MTSTLRTHSLALAVLLGVLLGVAPAGATTHAVPMPKVARVTVVDHTGGQWPAVQQVVDAWRRSPWVDAKVAAKCRPHTYCVTVEAVAAGPVDWHGQAWPTTWSSATVQLNTSVPADARLQSAVWCHELGHALGIAHPDGTEPAGRWGCIAGTEGGQSTPTPSRADMAQLTAIHTGTGIQGTPQEWGALYAPGVSR